MRPVLDFAVPAQVRNPIAFDLCVLRFAGKLLQLSVNLSYDRQPDGTDFETALAASHDHGRRNFRHGPGGVMDTRHQSESASFRRFAVVWCRSE